MENDIELIFLIQQQINLVQVNKEKLVEFLQRVAFGVPRTRLELART